VVARRSLFGNQLTGDLPFVNFAEKMTALTELSLNNNSLTGWIPPSWGSFPALKSMCATRPAPAHHAAV
jgi:hypothetical protein